MILLSIRFTTSNQIAVREKSKQTKVRIVATTSWLNKRDKDKQFVIIKINYKRGHLLLLPGNGNWNAKSFEHLNTENCWYTADILKFRNELDWIYGWKLNKYNFTDHKRNAISANCDGINWHGRNNNTHGCCDCWSRESGDGKVREVE